LTSGSLTSFQRSMSLSRLRESIRIRRIAPVGCARARNADRGHVAAHHEIAQRPVAAAKIRRCRSKVHESATWRSRSLAHGNTCLMNEIQAGHHVRGHARARPRRGQGRQPASRVERSESLEDAEARARISVVMAGSGCDGAQAVALMFVRWTCAEHLHRLVESQQRSLVGAMCATRHLTSTLRCTSTADCSVRVP
jgi:hypothetical protein